MRHRKSRGFDNRRVVSKGVLDFRRSDLRASAIDDVLDAPRYEEKPVKVEVAEVAGPKPAVAKSRLRFFGAPSVLEEDRRSPHLQLARRAAWHFEA